MRIHCADFSEYTASGLIEDLFGDQSLHLIQKNYLGRF